MAFNWSTKKETPSAIAEAVNEANLFAKVSWLIGKVKDLEKEIVDLKEEKSSGRNTRISWGTYILECLKDGKIWNIYAMAEEIHERHPEIREPNSSSLYYPLSIYIEDGKVERVGAGAYRLVK